MFWRTGHDRSRSPEFKFESKRPKVFGSLVPFVSPKKSSQSLPAVWRIGALAGIAVALILSLSAPKLRAQATVLGTLTGTITDPSGATVPGAKVTATNIATNEARAPERIRRANIVSPICFLANTLSPLKRRDSRRLSSLHSSWKWARH